MGTPVFYPNFKLKQNNGARNIDLDTATIKVAILTNSYVPNSADDLFSGISANEVSGAGYTAGGTAISGVTYALDGNNAEWVHNDITWTQNAGGFTNGRIYVWYDVTTGGLICRMAEAADFGNVAGDLTLDVTPTTGIVSVQ